MMLMIHRLAALMSFALLASSVALAQDPAQPAPASPAPAAKPAAAKQAPSRFVIPVGARKAATTVDAKTSTKGCCGCCEQAPSTPKGADAACCGDAKPTPPATPAKVGDCCESDPASAPAKAPAKAPAAKPASGEQVPAKPKSGSN